MHVRELDVPVTDPKLPADLLAKVAAVLPCWGLNHVVDGHQSCFEGIDDHFADCPAKRRPAVEALIAKVHAQVGLLQHRYQLLADELHDVRAERDTLRRELAEAREALETARVERDAMECRAQASEADMVATETELASAAREAAAKIADEHAEAYANSSKSQGDYHFAKAVAANSIAAAIRLTTKAPTDDK
jgi:hypothetical protein